MGPWIRHEVPPDVGNILIIDPVNPRGVILNKPQLSLHKKVCVGGGRSSMAHRIADDYI